MSMRYRLAYEKEEADLAHRSDLGLPYISIYPELKEEPGWLTGSPRLRKEVLE